MTDWNESVRKERERRMREVSRADWTQEAVAERVGMSLRAYQGFETGETNPRGSNKKAILREFGYDDGQEDKAEETRESWPADIAVFLDMMGAFLATMSEADRLAFMHDETRRIIAAR